MILYKMIIVSVILTFLNPIAAFSAEKDKIKVFVSVLPHAYFAEKIGGDRVDVQVLVQPGHSPATYSPTPRQMSELAQARLFFRAGVPFEEAWMRRLEENNPQMRVIDLRKGIKLRTMKSHHHHHDNEEEDHESGDDHETDPDDDREWKGKDPHIWLNPNYAKIQAQTIEEALCASLPNHANEFKNNLARLDKELSQLDQYITEKLRSIRSRKFIVFHPAWGYFADAYNLEQIPIEIEGKTPTARQLQTVINRAKRENLRVIFVQEQFNKTAAQAVANAIGGQAISVDPLAKDYIANLRKVTEIFTEAIR